MSDIIPDRRPPHSPARRVEIAEIIEPLQPDELRQLRRLLQVYSDDSPLDDSASIKEVRAYMGAQERLDQLQRQESNTLSGRLARWGIERQLDAVGKTPTAVKAAVGLGIVGAAAIAGFEVRETVMSAGQIPQRILELVQAGVTVDPSQVDLTKLFPRFESGRFQPPDPGAAIGKTAEIYRRGIELATQKLSTQIGYTGESVLKAAASGTATVVGVFGDPIGKAKRVYHGVGRAAETVGRIWPTHRR